MKRPYKINKLNIDYTDLPEEETGDREISIKIPPEESSEFLNVDLDNSPVIVEDTDSSTGIQNNQGVPDNNSFTLDIYDLPDFNETFRLQVEIDSSFLCNQTLQINACPGCEGIINSDDQHLCEDCSFRLNSTSESLSNTSRSISKYLLMATAAVIMIVTFVGISTIIADPFSESNVPEPTPEPVPDPAPNSVHPGDYISLQGAIDEAGDGDEIVLDGRIHYGPLDFKGKNLTLRLSEEAFPESQNAETAEVSVVGATVTLVDAPQIEALLKGYTITEKASGRTKEFTYKTKTNYSSDTIFPGTYLEVKERNQSLVIRGRTKEKNNKIRIDIDSGNFEGQYETVTGSNQYFELTIQPTGTGAGERMETATLDVRKASSNRGPFQRFYTNLRVNFYFDGKDFKKVEFSPSLAYDGNKQAWNTKREPSSYLEATSRIQSEESSIVEKADSLFEMDMSDYEKLVAIHDWVTTNIAYDAHYIATGERVPQDAVTVLEQEVGVCAGYANIMAALLRSQGIPARYVSGYALGSHDSGLGWENEGLYGHSVGHAWNEVYIDGEWITVDATWNAGYIDSRSGEFVFDQNFRYFAPSLEFFSRSHFIPVRR